MTIALSCLTRVDSLIRLVYDPGHVPAGTGTGGAMRISSVTTLRLREYPNLCYVALGTDDGLTGIGETFFGARAVAAWVHETAAAYLLGKDPRTIERHSRALEG